MTEVLVVIYLPLAVILFVGSLALIYLGLASKLLPLQITGLLCGLLVTNVFGLNPVPALYLYGLVAAVYIEIFSFIYIGLDSLAITSRTIYKISLWALLAPSAFLGLSSLLCNYFHDGERWNDYNAGFALFVAGPFVIIGLLLLVIGLVSRSSKPK